MEYFELTQSEKTLNPPKIIDLDDAKYTYKMSQDAFDMLDDLVVAYFSFDPSYEWCDILKIPTFMFSTELKELIGAYDPLIQFKGIQIFALEQDQKSNYKYWVSLISEISCVHITSKIYPNGFVDKLILDRNRMPENLPCFKVAGIFETKVVVNLPLAESILRRSLFGIQLNQLEVL